MSSTNPNSSSDTIEEEEPLSLSALVRTAETSRLRRRGAINGGHRGSRQSVTSFAGLGAPDTAAPAASNSNTSTQQYQWTRQSMPILPTPPPWTEGGPAYPSWASVPDPTKADDDAEAGSGPGYSLYCGIDEWEFGTDEPYEASPLPVSDNALPSTRSHQQSPQRLRRSTGCGALVHVNGSPRTKSWTWQAYGKATSDVVLLDKMYFERGGQPKQFACGCRWHGVGCSNWCVRCSLSLSLSPLLTNVFISFPSSDQWSCSGNTLGNIYVPCQAASAPSTLTRSQSRSSRAARSQPNSSAHFMYTFFSDAVSSSPPFVFPKCPSSSSHSHGPHLNGPLAAAPQAWEVVSASSIDIGSDPEYTYGYAEQEQEQEQEEPGAEYDPNGVLITNVPGSPDKSAEPMLWPAR